MNFKCTRLSQLSRLFVKWTVVLALVIVLMCPNESFGNTVRRRRKRLDSSRRRYRHGHLNMWIDERQVRLFSGFPMTIHIISDGVVQPYILEPNFNRHLPTIPSDVGMVNFTWSSGYKNYFYDFEGLQSFDETILHAPVVSISEKGIIPKKPKQFSVFLPCSGDKSGIAEFTVRLRIETRKRKPLPGMPLGLKLRKDCTVSRSGPDPECDKKCRNNGWCNKDGVCHCPEGYMGQHCQTALCYPTCANNGTCIAPGKCDCPLGYHGTHCEGGICDKGFCKNRGKCIQKNVCKCRKGYYGLRCEYSKCMIPCLHKGRCKGINKCRCKAGFSGDHCEIRLTNRTMSQRHICSFICKHGNCVGPNKCECHEDWYGRRCNRRSLRVR